jgi:RNA polymerase sigma-70 factor (ECF subfamily)
LAYIGADAAGIRDEAEVKKYLYKIRTGGVYVMNMESSGPCLNWCETLYNDKASEFILYGRALGLSHGEAEDVLQDTFRALLALPVPPERPVHYAVRAYRNRATNHRRSLWRRLAREHKAGQWFETDAGISPDEERAMAALTKLPAEQREVIVLKIWHGCTFEEIGGLLEISPNTVAGRYRYGLQKIKAQLGGLNYEPDELERGANAFLAATPGLADA